MTDRPPTSSAAAQKFSFWFKIALAITFLIAFVGVIAGGYSPASGGAPQTSPAAKAKTPEVIPSSDSAKHSSEDSARYFIERGAGFKDRAAVLELVDAYRRTPNQEERKGVMNAIRRRLTDENRRFQFSSQIVRVLKKESELDGFCEVVRDDSLSGDGFKTTPFWVHSDFLKVPLNFRVLPGDRIFSGKVGSLLREDSEIPIRNLLDLIVAVYNGDYTEAEAIKCVFLSSAQRSEEDVAEVESLLPGFVIYNASYYGNENRENVRFAMPRVGGNDDPLGSGPVRFVGRKEFTTSGGVVMSIPVVAIQGESK